MGLFDAIKNFLDNVDRRETSGRPLDMATGRPAEYSAYDRWMGDYPNTHPFKADPGNTQHIRQSEVSASMAAYYHNKANGG